MSPTPGGDEGLDHSIGEDRDLHTRTYTHTYAHTCLLWCVLHYAGESTGTDSTPEVSKRKL